MFRQAALLFFLVLFGVGQSVAVAAPGNSSIDALPFCSRCPPAGHYCMIPDLPCMVRSCSGVGKCRILPGEIFGRCHYPQCP